jgi:hypothetical protein
VIRAAWIGAILMSGAASAADPRPLTERECHALVEPANGPAEVRELPGIVVLDEKAVTPFVPPQFPDAAAVRTIVCWRSVARFVLSDRRVADAGLRLAVKAQGVDGAPDRALVLEKMNNGFRIRALQGGAFTPVEQQQVVELLQKLNGAENVPTHILKEQAL